MEPMHEARETSCEEGDWALEGPNQPAGSIHEVQLRQALPERLVVMKHMHAGRAPGILLFRTTDPRMLFGSPDPNVDIITNDSLRLILPPSMYCYHGCYCGTSDSMWGGQCNRDRLGWSMFVTHKFGGKLTHYRIFHETPLQARESHVVKNKSQEHVLKEWRAEPES